MYGLLFIIYFLQVESLFESMYSNIAVRPFGSTVNGFGKLGCDLDLVLTNIITDEMVIISELFIIRFFIVNNFK